MTVAVYEVDSSECDALKKFLEYDPYLDKALNEEQLKKLRDDKEANIIFSRQEYSLRDGTALGLDSKKYYLYINANDDFLAGADTKLKKNFKSVKRAQPDAENTFKYIVDQEHDMGNAGIGAIFGG